MNLHNIMGGYRYANVEPEEHHLLELKSETSKELKHISSMIVDAFHAPDLLLSEKYLTLPDSTSLHTIYTFNSLYYNAFQLSENNQKKLIDSLQKEVISRPDLVHSYYDLLFALATKRNRISDLSTVDIDLNRCVPDDSTGQTILFLDLVSICFKHVKSKPNLENTSPLKALQEEFERYPTFNSKPFYEMAEFPITDFQVNFYQGIGLHSFYRSKLNTYFTFLDGYYNTMKTELGELEAINGVWLKTALHKKELYPYLNPQLQQFFSEKNVTVNATLNKK